MRKVRVVVIAVFLVMSTACTDSSERAPTAQQRNIDTLRPAPTTGGGRVLVQKEAPQEAPKEGAGHLEVFKKQLRENGVDPENIDDEATKRAAMGWR